MRAILTVGIPGSGKSTFADSISETYLKIELDEIRDSLDPKLTHKQKTAKALKIRDAKLEEAANKSKNIVLSDTNINEEFRDNLIAKLEKLGYTVSLKVLDVDLEICKQRNSERVGEQKVPDEVIEQMYKNLQEQYWLWV